MTGRITLAEIRAELEAALGAGFVGEGEVAESLSRFLAARSEGAGASLQNGDGTPVLSASRIPQLPTSTERGR